MNPFRTILATLLALLIVSPLCCCSARTADAPAGPSCCQMKKEGKESPDREPHICACKTKQPRDQVKDFELPHDIAVVLEPVVIELAYLSPPAAVSQPMASTPHTGCDPPRLKLARYSRWLI